MTSCAGSAAFFEHALKANSIARILIVNAKGLFVWINDVIVFLSFVLNVLGLWHADE